MEVRVLGSLEIWDGKNQVEIAGAKRRAVLALLVLHANEVVAKDRLIDELWSESPPRTAAASLHNHVSRLRKALGPDRLITRAWGYVLRIDPKQVDLHRFEYLIREAEPLPARERSAKLGEALALWRGPALADLAFDPALAKESARLDELRLAVLEARIDADLEVGHNAHLIGELEALISDNPLRERLRGQLILALYRDGRQAEALEVYRETRRLLTDELGLEPSPALRELERAILRQDPSLVPAAPALPVEDMPALRRRWLVYVALAGAALVAVGSIAAFAAIQLAESSHRAFSSATTNRTGAAIPSAPVRPEQDVSHSASLSSHKASARRGEKTRIAANRTLTGNHRSGSLRKAASTQASPAGSTSNLVSKSRSRQTPHEPTGGKKKRRTAPPKKVRLVDTFAGGTMNPQIWSLATWGTGVDVAQKSGRLELTMHTDATPDARWNAMAGGYQTACSLIGDFDARISYTLLNWPAANGTVAALNVSFPDNVVNIVRASRASGQEDYSFAAPSGEWRVLHTTDTSGGFRMTRVGSLITSYIRRGRDWVRFESTRRSGAVTLQAILWASGSDFAHKDVTVAFDNFMLVTPAPGCA
jgi:DNA-binding SARP family transcriptional activator